MSDDSHEVHMRAALAQARRARDAGEVPVGAVVVQAGRVVGRGFNQPIGGHDPTAHAEVVALRDAARALGNYRLAGTILYVTVEPCLMCAGAIVHARVRTLVYGAEELKAGAVRSAMQALDNPALNHHVTVVSGVLEIECRDIMREFFKGRRSPDGAVTP
jgi:tRNA(adenine34) deaminase